MSAVNTVYTVFIVYTVPVYTMYTVYTVFIVYTVSVYTMYTVYTVEQSSPRRHPRLPDRVMICR